MYGGNLLTSDHGVLRQNPVGVMDYIEDTNSSTSQKESLNSSYTLIQPPLAESDLSIPSSATDPEGYAAAVKLNEVEKQKYSYKAGLTIRVDAAGNLSYHSYERTASGELDYDGSGVPKVRTLVPANPVATRHLFTETSGVITSGFHDKREAEDLNVIEIDVGVLKDLVHNNDESEWGGLPEQQPSDWWNGVVYVDFPQTGSHGSRDDNVNPAVDGWAVKLVNGGVIPNPTFAHGDSVYGMTLATNQLLYVKGDYNADGDGSTGSARYPDSDSDFAKQGSEAPAALVGDSITILSNSWDDSKSNLDKFQRLGTHTEISAAILTGNVPSAEYGGKTYSGGVENFPRTIERWKNSSGVGQPLIMRGSIVALFESEVGRNSFGRSDVYSPPTRMWGFHSKFAEGYLPPGTPNTRRFRAIDFELLDETTYEQHVARIQNGF
jgi:hypothetical protein